MDKEEFIEKESQEKIDDNITCKELKKHKRKKKRRKIFRRILISLISFVLIISLISVAGLNLYLYKKTDKLVTDIYFDAKYTILTTKRDKFLKNTESKIYASDGTIIATLKDDNTSQYLTYDKIPKQVINAFISIEDKSYWTNKGFDIQAMIRAAFNIISNKKITQGGSTITQQLSKLVFLNNEKSIERKLKEMFLSYFITKEYTKEEIIEFYINHCCFANNTYGIQDASQLYFNKDAKDLTLGEITYLVTIPNWPEHYNPYKGVELAKGRQKRILNAMLSEGYINKTEYNEAINYEIKIQPKKPELIKYNYESSFAIKCAIEYMMEMNGFDFEYQWDNDQAYKDYNDYYKEAYTEAKKELYGGGYEIYTSINLETQKIVQEQLDEKLKSYDELQGAITVMDNETNKVVAIVGGRSDLLTEQKLTSYTYNRAFQARRQPGSAIKPIVVYAPALEKGLTPESMVKEVDVKKAYKSKGKIQELSGYSLSMLTALQKSKNGAAIYTLDKIGVNYGLGKLPQLGFESFPPSDYNVASAIGGFTYGTTTNEMAGAYSTLKNSGKYIKPTCIKSIKDKNGIELYEEQKSKAVYTEEASKTITEMLKTYPTHGTAKGLGWHQSQNEAAMKTGTTNDNKDAWLCGFTDKYTASVWVGYDDNRATSFLSGGGLSGKIWRDVLYALGE